MTALIAVAGLLMQLALLAALIIGTAFCAWVLWDITIGPSAQDAATRRRRTGGARR